MHGDVSKSVIHSIGYEIYTSLSLVLALNSFHGQLASRKQWSQVSPKCIHFAQTVIS